MTKKIILPKTDFIYKPEGGLATPIKAGRRWNWTHCREVFHRAECRYHGSLKKRIVKTGKLLYYSKDVSNSIAFVKMAEKLLKLPVKKRAKIYRTNKQNVIYLVYGPWWSQIARRDLFTIFLRIGRNYNVRGKTEVEKIARWWRLAKRNRYITRTKIAFQKFMEGRSKFNPSAIVEVPTYDYITGRVTNVSQPIQWRGWCETLQHLNAKQVEERLKECQ